jgi:hypothetical protein
MILILGFIVLIGVAGLFGQVKISDRNGQVQTNAKELSLKPALAEIKSAVRDYSQPASEPIIPEQNEPIEIPEVPIDVTRANRTASVSGNWNATATWGGAAVPVAGDAVTINSGITVTVTAPAACASITFAAVATNSVLTINGTNTLTVSGLISMPIPNTSRTCTINVNAGTVSCGSLTMSATTTTRNDVINITTGTMTVSGTLTSGTTGCRFVFTGAGTLDLNGTRSSSPAIVAVSGSTVKIGNGTLTAAQFSAMTLPVGSNLVYSGAAAQTIYATTYLGNLGFSGAGTKTIAAAAEVQVNGNITNSSTLVLTAGTSTTSTWFVMGGNVTNTGTINATADYIRFIFSSANAQTLTNTGTMTSPVSSFDVSNSNASGLTISSDSNTIVVLRANLFAGVVHNSNKITLGTGPTSYAVVQRGVASNTVPAGSFDVSPTFNIPTDGLILLYDNGSVAYSTGYEVPSNHTCDVFYLFDAADVSLSTDLTVTGILDFAGGTGTASLHVGAYTLTIDGSLSYTVAGNIFGGTSSNLVINGASNVNAITNGLKYFTINAPCTLGGAITVYDTLTLTSGLLTNGSYLTMATGTTVSRAAAGSLYSAPTFAGTVNLLYTGATPIVAGKELPTSASVINNLTTNPGGFTQYAYSIGTPTNLLTDAFPNLTSWTGNIGTGDGTFSSSATTSAGGTSPEVKYTGCFDGPYTHSNTTYSIYRSTAINTTGYDAINVAFKSTAVGRWQIDYPTSLHLQCATSTSGPWSDIWSMGYAEHAATNMSALGYTTNVGGNMYVRFAFIGDWYCLDNWNFDNLVIDGIGSTPITSNVTVNGTLYLVGDYTIGVGNTLTMASGATINRSGGELSDEPTFVEENILIYTGDTPITTGNEVCSDGVYDCVINNSAGVTLGADMTVYTLTFTSGSLGFDGHLLTLAGKDFAVSGLGTISALAVALANEDQTCNGHTSLARTWTTSGAQDGNLAVTLSYPVSLANDDYMWVWTRTVGGPDCWTYEAYLPTIDLGTVRSLTTVFTSLNGVGRADKETTITKASTYTLIVKSSGTDQPGTEIFRGGVTTGEFTNFTFTSNSPGMLQGSYSPGAAPSGHFWTNTPILVSVSDFTFENGYTVTILFLLDDGTLPVELSSFSAAMSGTNSVHITWVTQSETEVLGFHILRSLEEDLSTALQISDLIPATNTSQTKVYLYKDKDLNQEGTYYYWLQNTELNGETEYYGPINVVYSATQNETPTIPKVTGLSTIYPNPFNPSTTIKYGLANAETFDITIYNSRGQIVKVMERAHKEAGNYSAFWNGTDEQGKACGTGVYYVKMQAGKSSFTRKMVLMK